MPHSVGSGVSDLPWLSCACKHKAFGAWLAYVRAPYLTVSITLEQDVILRAILASSRCRRVSEVLRSALRLPKWDEKPTFAVITGPALLDAANHG